MPCKTNHVNSVNVYMCLTPQVSRPIRVCACKRARSLSCVYHTYNTLFGVLQVLEHAINQITLQRHDILYCIIVVGNCAFCFDL